MIINMNGCLWLYQSKASCGGFLLCCCGFGGIYESQFEPVIVEKLENFEEIKKTRKQKSANQMDHRCYFLLSSHNRSHFLSFDH